MNDKSFILRFATFAADSGSNSDKAELVSIPRNGILSQAKAINIDIKLHYKERGEGFGDV